MIVHVPAQYARLPFQRVNVKIGDGPVIRQRVIGLRKLIAGRARAVEDCAQNVRRVLPAGFHNINFARRGPVAVGIVRGEKPERGPIAFADGEFGSPFKTAVHFGEQASRNQPGRSESAAFDPLMDDADVEQAVFDIHVFGQVGVILHFAIAPAPDELMGVGFGEAIAEIEGPFGAIEMIAFEFVAPDEFPGWIGGGGDGNEGKKGGEERP